MKNKLKSLTTNKKSILSSSLIAFILYLFNWSFIGWIFLLLPATALTKKTNNAIRKIKNWVAWSIFLLIQLFFLLIFATSMRNASWLLAWISDFLIIYFLTQIIEIIWFSKTHKKENTKKTKIFSQPTLIVLGIIIFIIIVVIKCQKDMPTVTDSISITSPTPVEHTLGCIDDINDLYSKNDKSISSLIKQSKQIKWNGTKYNLIIFNCPNQNDYSYSQVFALTKVSNDNTKEKLLFTMADESIFEADLRDINKDGLAELEISSSNGGNCRACSGFSVFQMVGDKFNDLLVNFPKSDEIKSTASWISDLNDDGIQELIVDDELLGSAFDFIHAYAPTHVTIYSWKDNEYKKDSSSFSKFYLNQIAKRNADYKKILLQKEPISNIQQLIRIAVENYYDYSTIGKSDLGYDTFIRQTDYDSFPKTIVLEDSDKVWLNGLRQDIEENYKDTKSPKMPLY